MMMDYLSVARQYYACWLGIPKTDWNQLPSISFISSSERDVVQPGYSKPFDLYVWIEDNRIIVSYGSAVTAQINQLEEIISEKTTVEMLFNAIQNIYGKAPTHSFKFVYHECDRTSNLAQVLSLSDAENYLTFFKKANPYCEQTDWVYDYFSEISAKHYCCGIYESDALVSCTDAPDMPYMENKVQEIGISTLPQNQKKGYAADACKLCAEMIIQSGKCPLWSCDADNAASASLATKIGFCKLADVLTLSV